MAAREKAMLAAATTAVDDAHGTYHAAESRTDGHEARPSTQASTSRGERGLPYDASLESPPGGTEMIPAASRNAGTEGDPLRPACPPQGEHAEARVNRPQSTTNEPVGTTDTVGGGDVYGNGGGQSLLDLLVDVCAAPPPYSLGAGIGALGRDACSAAIHTFGLVSASLFEVAGSPQAMAVRVAVVQQGQTVERGGEGGERAGDPAAVDPTAAEAECGIPERERLGDGTVGVAARSARPVCIEVPYPSSGDGKVGGLTPLPPGYERARAVTDGTIAVSTVLCIPVMLQAAPLSKALTGSVGDGSGEVEGLAPSVEVVGVLRAVRAGTGAFVGDDARAMSAFCGQLALAIVAERMLAESRADAAAEAAKAGRTLRRNACRRVAELFADGAVAGALLKRNGRAAAATRVSSAVPTSATADMDGICAVGEHELWASVAGLAAQAMGCERVDLLRVASLAGGTVSDAPSLADFLSQRPPSRSFRRRSREALLEARESSGSMFSSVEGAMKRGVKGRGDMIRTWLCVPVLGASGEAVGRSDGAGSAGRREDGGAVTVCCAVNKGSGRSFDDVDEVRSYTAVCASVLVTFVACVLRVHLALSHVYFSCLGQCSMRST